jgi:hypothetical protein
MLLWPFAKLAFTALGALQPTPRSCMGCVSLLSLNEAMLSGRLQAQDLKSNCQMTNRVLQAQSPQYTLHRARLTASGIRGNEQGCLWHDEGVR